VTQNFFFHCSANATACYFHLQLTIQKISKQQGPKSAAVHFPVKKKRSYYVVYV